MFCLYRFPFVDKQHCFEDKRQFIVDSKTKMSDPAVCFLNCSIRLLTHFKVFKLFTLVHQIIKLNIMTQYIFSVLHKNLLALIYMSVISSGIQAQNIQKVKEINPSNNSSPFDFTISGNKLFFIANDNVNGNGLWITDGAVANTIKLTSSATPINSIDDIIAYNNKVYFSYNDGVNGYELWVSDGTIAGTTLFKDIVPGSGGSYPKAFTVANNKLFFMSDIDHKLYVCDGTAAGTAIIKNNGVALFNGLADFAVMNTDIYFTSDNGTGSGYGLWKSDGTLAGTVLVKPDIISTFPGNYAVLNNQLYFNSFDGINGSELWVSDGTAAGTNMVINLRAESGGTMYSGNPDNFIVYNNKVYFSANDDVHGRELFSSDGTLAGTQLVKDMEPGINGSYPLQNIVYNGQLFFCCNQGGIAYGLWKSDGTSAGTTLIKSGGGAQPFLNDLRAAAVWNGKLYFTVNDNQFYPVWQTDGTTAGTVPIVLQNTINPVSSFSNAFQFAAYNAELYFSGKCTGFATDYELCKLSSGILPVTWLGIQAQWQNGQARITWQVAEQVNVKNYNVQQSINGYSFTDACVVNAANTNNYSCIIAANRNSKSYYRIMQKDVDGKINHSNTVTLNPFPNISLSLYPNPAKEKLYVHGLRNFSAAVITDVNGKIIDQFSFITTSNYFDISRLAKGIYFVRIIEDEAEQTIKFIKE